MLFLTGGAGAPASYQISRSLRFNDDDSPRLDRTPSSAGNRRTWTWSGWLKRGNLGLTGAQFWMANTANTDAGNFEVRFGSGDQLFIYGWTTTWRQTTQVFRDTLAWYHIVIAVDTTNATANNRIRLYVNGSEVTTFTTLNNPSLNADLGVNSTGIHRISGNGVPDGLYFDGYLAEVHFVDGQQLTPSSFGETDATTGAWKPKWATGITYGTNGFWLSFANNTSTTTLGQDDAGGAAGSGAGSNDWTLNNFSVTAGAGNDSLVDTPTNNYCTWSAVVASATSGASLANGSLDWTRTGATGGANDRSGIGTFGMSAGKWYWENEVGTIGTNNTLFYGICTGAGLASTYGGSQSTSWGYLSDTGNRIVAGVSSAYGASFTTGDIIGLSFDADAGTLIAYKNGTSQGTIATGLTSGPYFPMVSTSVGGGGTTGLVRVSNFGQRPFAYTPPTGFVALNTANLPTPTIRKPNQHFNAVTYTGTGSSLAVTGVGHQPDLAWIKSRSAATDHALYDAVRGVQARLESNQTDAEATSDNGLTAFGTDGFTVNTLAQVNTNTATYVGWCWKEGVTPGFDIVSYTGNGSNRTIAHNLGAAPHFMIVKHRGTASNWIVWHRSFATASNTDYLFLQSTGARGGGGSLPLWNSTVPTSSVFSLGTDSNVNQNTDTYIAYLFTEISGFSRFGSYTGNGSADGPFVWCGFRPRWLIMKRTDGTGGWYIFDSVRETGNVMTFEFAANASHAENTYGTLVTIDILANGFKLRNTDAEYNASGGTYVYAAFSEAPFKYSLAR